MSVIPEKYELEFEPDLKNFTFKGKEIVYVNCKSFTNKIILNAIELKINRCTIKVKNKTIKPKKIHLIKPKRELEITLPEKIKGKATIYFEFTGILNDELRGFYRSQYKVDGKTTHLATTQFEEIDACRAFPCWDYPSAKATFDITIITDDNLTAISNMPVSSKKKDGKKTIFKFAQTPVMSTYLVYLGVGNYGMKSKKTKDDRVEIRFIAPPGNEEKGEFALDLTVKLLKEYENYFGIKYPLPKLDLIAIPDFGSSAMENWGAITFREAVIYYPQTTSADSLLYNATTISHEIAHQWFGNLVTMKWWNDLWLNESFATFMATKFVDKFYPEWDVWDQFIGTDTDLAMELDSLKTSHPIDVDVKDPGEISEIFDAISYEKGGSFLLMLEKYVGESDFQKGLKTYLKKFQYKNAAGADLWKEISQVSTKPGVLKMVNYWLKQVGYPVVTVTKQNSKITLTQDRFLRLPEKQQKAVWPIPVSIGLEKELTNKLMVKKSETIPIEQNTVIVNYGRSGFYRVKYDDELLSNLKLLVKNKEISHMDRWAIQYDLFALCMSGNESVKNFLSFINAYDKEDNYLPLSNIIKNLNFLYSITFFEEFNSEIRDIAINLLRNILQKLTWDPKNNEKNTQIQLRSQVIESLGKMEDKEVILEAKKKFKQYIKKPGSISADLQKPILITVAWNGDRDTYKELTRSYTKAETQEEKVRLLSALSYFKDKNLILETLEFALSDSVRTPNMDYIFKNIAQNPYGSKILWVWLKKNWKRLTKKTGEGNTVLKKIIGTVSKTTDDTMIKEVQEFFEENPTQGTKNTLLQELERVKIYSKFLKRIKNEFS